MNKVAFDNWIVGTMPVMIEFVTDESDDRWLRDKIAGRDCPPPETNRVVVQGTAEAERIMTALPNLKYARHLPYGGAIRARAAKNDDDTWRFYSEHTRS